MNPKTKLELTWIGKDQCPRLEPRILLEDPALSYHAEHRVTDNDLFDSRVIFGDNLLALKALEQELTGKIKCVYIDPPFNTQQAFEHYEDGLEHSLWLKMMRDRIEILYSLLHEEGSMFVHIDDNELAYLTVLMDEKFGRKNRIAIITFKQSSVSGPKAMNPGLVTTSNFVLMYAKDKNHWKPGRAYVPTKRDTRYSGYIVNYDENYYSWKIETLRTVFAKEYGVKPSSLQSYFGDELETKIEEFVLASPKRVVRLARVTPKDVNAEARIQLASSLAKPNIVQRAAREDKEDYYFLNGQQLLFYSSKVKWVDGRWVTGEPASTIWDDLLSNNIHNEGGVEFPNGKKPEALIKRCLELSTLPGDWVLDSFAGSGTTGAVAHKMGRRFVMIELGDHAHTHILPRLHKVIDGTDQGGISQAAGWKGGGGFRYYKLAPSLLKQDKWGQWVINKDYNPAMLAEAVCKHEGFLYAPSDTEYWNHGHSTERDFIYVTTQTLTQEQIAHLADEIGDDRTLLVCCAAFRGSANAFPNLTLRKIPNAIASQCEWGHDDYSLQIASLPPAPAAETRPQNGANGRKSGTQKRGSDGMTLFDDADPAATPAERGEDA